MNQEFMASEPNMFMQPHAPSPWRNRWKGCWGGLFCFWKHKGGKRIVPASRTPEGNAGSNNPNRLPAGGFPSQTTGTGPAFYAPPSSPASFLNSALPSTAPSPSCFLSSSSPGDLSSTMFATGPYANDTQLVSPPVFSTFATEPSTASLTPPPELAHVTTPSSPDVPYARFLLSSANVKRSGKDFQAYSLDPESPASALRSPISRTPGDCLSPSYTMPESGRSVGVEVAGASKTRQDANFFCPETFAQFYQDQSSFSQAGGRLSISKESEAYSNVGNGHQNWQSKVCKPDAEELEAYRASFGFSADEIITTVHYVEISDLSEHSFSMTPLRPNQSVEEEEHLLTEPLKPEVEKGKRQENFRSPQLNEAGLTRTERVTSVGIDSFNSLKDRAQQKRLGSVYGQRGRSDHFLSDDDSNMCASGIAHNYQLATSNSDAEIEYKRGQSWRGG